MRPLAYRFSIMMTCLSSAQAAVSGDLTAAQRVDLAFTAIDCAAYHAASNPVFTLPDTAETASTTDTPDDLPRMRPSPFKLATTNDNGPAQASVKDCNRAPEHSPQSALQFIDLESVQALDALFQEYAGSVRATIAQHGASNSGLGDFANTEDAYERWLETGEIEWTPSDEAREP